MNSYRNPIYLDRKEDVVFDRGKPLPTDPGNNAVQKREGLRFVVDNSGEVTPFDW